MVLLALPLVWVMRVTSHYPLSGTRHPAMVAGWCSAPFYLFHAIPLFHLAAQPELDVYYYHVLCQQR